MAKPTRVKAAATPSKVQSHDDLVNGLARLTELHVQRTQEANLVNAEVLKLTQAFDLVAKPIDDEAAALAKDIQRYAEVHRVNLTADGKVKTARFATGDIGWRNDPPSVSVPRDQAVQVAIIDELEVVDASLIRRVRFVDKDAILTLWSWANGNTITTARDRELAGILAKVEAIPGLKIKTGVEKFFIKPKGIDDAPQSADDEVAA